MRQNVHTQVAESNRADASALDLAVEKPGTADREIRYDVDLAGNRDGAPVARSAKNGTRFALYAGLPGANGDSAEAIVAAAGAEALVAFAQHQPATVGGRKYYSLGQFLANRPAPAQLPGEPLAVTRVSPALAAELGFTPTVAVRL